MPMQSALVLLLMALATICRAETTEYSDFVIGAGASVTQGVGIDIAQKISPKTRFRFSMYAWDYERTEIVEDIHYDAELEMIHPGFFVDYHPFSKQHKGLRLTAGLILNSNRWRGDAAPVNETFIIDGTTYRASDVGNLRGEIEFPLAAPYLGVGYDWKINNNWYFTSELGVVYQGIPEVKLSADGTLTREAVFQDALRREEANILEDIEDVKAWPVLKISIEYNF